MTVRFCASFLPLTCAFLLVPGSGAQTPSKAPAAVAATTPATDRAASYYH